MRKVKSQISVKFNLWGKNDSCNSTHEIILFNQWYLTDLFLNDVVKFNELVKCLNILDVTDTATAICKYSISNISKLISCGMSFVLS